MASNHKNLYARNDDADRRFHSRSTGPINSHDDNNNNNTPENSRLRLKRPTKSAYSTPKRYNKTNRDQHYNQTGDDTHHFQSPLGVNQHSRIGDRYSQMNSPSRTELFHSGISGNWITGDDFVVINQIEEAKYKNNLTFGLPKWKGHLSTRPLEARSPQIRRLYQASDRLSKPTVNCCTYYGNILYLVSCGWWLCLVYLFFGVLMTLTICGYQYGKYSFRLALYFLWPFGQFICIQKKEQECIIPNTPIITSENMELSKSTKNYESIGHVTYDMNNETTIANVDDEKMNGYLHAPNGNANPRQISYEAETRKFRAKTGRGDDIESQTGSDSSKNSFFKEIKEFFTMPSIFRYPVFWLWLILVLPFLFIIHAILFIISWAMIISIPLAKVHRSAIFKLFYLHPETTFVKKSKNLQPNDDIVLCTYSAFNHYYMKYTIDGMNVIMFNMFFLVIFALISDYTIQMFLDAKIATIVKFVISTLGVIPLAYYIGMAIASISAQSTYAIGSVLNATFGSIVEITLYIATLYHGHKSGRLGVCSEIIVKHSLTGSLLLTMLLIPGLSMVVGGIKFQEQNFNARSAGVSSTLLFVSVAGAFAPTFFNKAYGMYACQGCTWIDPYSNNLSNSSHIDYFLTKSAYNLTSYDNFNCSSCQYPTDYYSTPQTMILAYICMSILPIAYIAGMIYSLGTHKYIYKLSEEDAKASHDAHWGRLKSTIILVFMTVLMALLADQIAENVSEVMESVSFITPAFLGTTIYAVLPDIPELVTGIQFSLQGMISLSIEVGNQIAVQICLLQIPILVISNIIFPHLHFILIFNDLQIFSVLLGVLVINYIFSDSKSDYFQGTSLIVIYVVMLAIFFLAPDDVCS